MLSDRSARRVRFLNQVIRELELENVVVLEGEIGPRDHVEELFDTIVARGVATAPVVWDMVHAHLAERGCVLVYESTQVGLESDPDLANDELSKNDQNVNQQSTRSSRHLFSIPGLPQPHSILCLEHI